MLTVDEASALILADVPRLGEVVVPLALSAGRVLAEDCASDVDMPPFDKAMMDGYALRSADTGALEVLEEIPAGKVPTVALRPGTCSKIMTGAPLPAGADAIQQVEKTRRDGARVTLLEAVRPGHHIAPKGQELKTGEVVLRKGHVIRAAEVGTLAAIGKTAVRVAVKPRVAVVATGDELVPPEQRPGPGQIRNSNTFSIAAQVRELGLECDDLGIVRDEPESIRAAIREGLKRDVLLLSGGVSAGDWDLVVPALEAEGVTIRTHRVRIKPGKPFCFAPRVFGLPGNPVSSFVIFEVFVRPYLGRMMGADLSRPRIRARLDGAVPKAIDRVHFLPALVRGERDGTVATLIPSQGSADLFALTKANAFVVVPVHSTVEKGALVECMLL